MSLYRIHHAGYNVWIKRKAGLSYQICAMHEDEESPDGVWHFLYSVPDDDLCVSVQGQWEIADIWNTPADVSSAVEEMIRRIRTEDI